MKPAGAITGSPASACAWVMMPFTPPKWSAWLWV